MSPPTSELHIDIEALSGICGSISIACWIVVFSPQIIENVRRSSADGLSLAFIIVWLLGDVFNILGAVLQGVLPTMIILAVYYTIADIVLLAQCFYYRGFTLSDAPTKPPTPPHTDEESTEHSPLLSVNNVPHSTHRPSITDASGLTGRTNSTSSYHTQIDITHLSPAIPLIPAPTSPNPRKAHSTLYTLLFNTGALLLVTIAGILGWWLTSHHSPRSQHHHHHHHIIDPLTTNPLPLNPLGQLFGYLCALLYLASRIPQILLNHRRKSTEGVSMLFFLFACVGNLTYVMSIFAYEPTCATGGWRVGCGEGEWGTVYRRYVLVNASWIAGSAGTLVLDLGIFAQFWRYGGGSD